MIKLTFILGFFLLTGISYSQSYNVIEAVEKKAIECKINGSWDSNSKQENVDPDGQYFGKCMTIKIQSKSPDTILIYIPNGLMLMSDDTTTQDMIVTKYCYATIAPRKSTSLEIYAMCSEIHDFIPNKEVNYRIGQMADTKLVAITDAINDMFMHNIVGQGAVWAYTDQATEEDLMRYGATESSLEMTVAVLNRAGVITQLNPPRPVNTLKKDPVFIANNLPTHVKEDKNVITLHAYLVYGGAALILILLGSTAFLILRKSKAKGNSRTIT